MLVHPGTPPPPLPDPLLSAPVTRARKGGLASKGAETPPTARTPFVEHPLCGGDAGGCRPLDVAGAQRAPPQGPICRQARTVGLGQRRRGRTVRTQATKSRDTSGPEGASRELRLGTRRYEAAGRAPRDVQNHPSVGHCHTWASSTLSPEEGGCGS